MFNQFKHSQFAGMMSLEKKMFNIFYFLVQQKGYK